MDVCVIYEYICQLTLHGSSTGVGGKCERFVDESVDNNFIEHTVTNLKKKIINILDFKLVYGVYMDRIGPSLLG